jgi:hypothetical protein
LLDKAFPDDVRRWEYPIFEKVRELNRRDRNARVLKRLPKVERPRHNDSRLRRELFLLKKASPYQLKQTNRRIFRRFHKIRIDEKDFLMKNAARYF